MSAAKRSEMPFVVSTSGEKANPALRKFIRSHVMQGKNLGKTRSPRRIEPHLIPAVASTSSSNLAASTTNSKSDESDGVPRPRGPSPSCAVALPMIPPKVGSDLSTVQFADAVEPCVVGMVLQFSSIAKRTLFPLESCIRFDRKEERWVEPLAFDPAYLHAMIFTTQDYFDSLVGRKPRAVSQRALPHFLKTLQILRERLVQENQIVTLSTPTVAVVMALAAHAHFVGDSTSARHHLTGLCKLIRLRGGISTFRDNAKLLVEILRCDLGIALHTGSKPLFLGSLSPTGSTRLLVGKTLAITAETSATICPPYTSDMPLNFLDDELVRVWKIMADFCSLINFVAETNHHIATEEFLDIMTSVMYPLLDMRFEAGSANEAIRLGMLAFSSGVFLQWKQLGLSYSHLAAAFRDCLAKLTSPQISTRLLLWLLMTGAVSIYGETDDVWLTAWLHHNIQVSGIESWSDMQDLLRSFMWIDLVHDELGRTHFQSALAYIV